MGSGVITVQQPLALTPFYVASDHKKGKKKMYLHYIISLVLYHPPPIPPVYFQPNNNCLWVENTLNLQSKYKLILSE